MLHRIAEDIWGHEADIELPAGMSMPGRATIMRLADGRLVVHSPLAIDDEVAREIDALGEVRVLLAPNSMHWMFLAAAKARYPKARVLLPPSLKKKLGDLPFEPLPESGHIQGLGQEIRLGQIQGAPSMTEHVFLHERSRSLVVSDLIFNIHDCRSFGMSCFLRVVGAWKKTAQSRMWRTLVKDRAAAARSATDILSWDFVRVVVAHGDVVEDDARERARRALDWMTSGALPVSAGSVIA
jgi:hypothetical protein